ncbi:MAG: dienelactone hydrolase family protein [Nocardioides sp.]
MATLDSWTRDLHESADGTTRPTYRKGTGPGVVVIHELPGMTPDVVAFGEEVAAAGFTVVMPVLFGTPGAVMSFPSLTSSLIQVCTSSEFTKLATGKTAPIADWLRSLARSLHEELGGPGVGALGMCFTGGFALAMMVDESVAAPVVAQPSLPFAIGKKRGADLNLSPADRDAMVARANAGCPVLGLRYRDDKATGSRFQTLESLLGENFIGVEFEGKGHATLTEHRQQEAVDRVLAFFGERLRA